MTTKLTNHKVFERPWNDEANDYVPTNHFLPLADTVKDIHGIRNEAGAMVDIPQRFVVHSPTGFEWGYGGSGPSDLALNILGLFVPPYEAWRLHHDYKFAVIGGLPHDRWTITAASVREWIERKWAVEAATK